MGGPLTGILEIVRYRKDGFVRVHSVGYPIRVAQLIVDRIHPVTFAITGTVSNTRNGTGSGLFPNVSVTDVMTTGGTNRHNFKRYFYISYQE